MWVAVYTAHTHRVPRTENTSISHNNLRPSGSVLILTLMFSLPFTGESRAGGTNSEIPAFEFTVIATWVESTHTHTLIVWNSKTSNIHQRAKTLKLLTGELNSHGSALAFT